MIKTCLLAASLCFNAFSERAVAPDFSLKDANGKSVRLSDFKGKIVLLDFWATWCHGCKEEIPWFIEFQSKYRQRGLEVVGVAMDEDGWKSVRPFIAKVGINYRIIIGSDTVANDYHVDSLPVSLLIDRRGKISSTHVGVADKVVFEKEIEALLH